MDKGTFTLVNGWFRVTPLHHVKLASLPKRTLAGKTSDELLQKTMMEAHGNHRFLLDVFLGTPRFLKGLIHQDFPDCLVKYYASPKKLMHAVFWVMVSNISYFHPYLGKIPILTSIFKLGHQPVFDVWKSAIFVGVLAFSW